MKLEDIVKRAETSREESAQAAARAEASSQAAAESAARAEQGAAEKGWLHVEGREDGHLYLITENMDTLTMEDRNGRLVVICE